MVQSVSIFRLGASLIFACLAFQDTPLGILVGLYSCAMVSDLIDGFLARRFLIESFAGRVIDLISDKSLTAVSLLYAAERGITLVPLALIAVRETIVSGLRAVVVGGSQVLPTSRIFGGIMAFVLWTNTLTLVITPVPNHTLAIVGSIYWACAAIFTANLVVRFYVSRHRLSASLTKAE